MNPFEDYVFQKFRQCILSWERPLLDDIYCLEILKGEHSDCQSGFSLSYNTLSHLQERMQQVGEAAKWDFAEWTCAYPSTVPQDDEEIKLWETWCRDNQVPINEEESQYYHEEQEEGETVYGQEYMYQALPLYRASRTLARNVAQRLHQEDVLLKAFGRPLPVYLTDMDGFFDRPGILAVNPSQVVEEFERAIGPGLMPEWAY